MKAQKNVQGHIFNLAGKGYDNLDNNHMTKSENAVPFYTNSDLNSRGLSFNPTPFERFDNSADGMLYGTGAYDSSRYSVQKNNLVSKPEDVKKTFVEENKALGGTGPGQSFTGTVSGSYTQVKAPAWLCSVICSGLDVDEVLDDSRVKAKTPNVALANNFDFVSSSSQEEQEVINVNQNQINSVAYTKNSFNKACIDISPKVADCVK